MDESDKGKDGESRSIGRGVACFLALTLGMLTGGGLSCLGYQNEYKERVGRNVVEIRQAVETIERHVDWTSQHESLNIRLGEDGVFYRIEPADPGNFVSGYGRERPLSNKELERILRTHDWHYLQNP